MPASSVIGWRVCKAFCARAVTLEDCALVLAEHLQPVRQVRGVILAGVRRDSSACGGNLHRPKAISMAMETRGQEAAARGG
jgi:hypothetical protein